MAVFSKIYRFYKYVYYRLYSWNLETWGESDLPQLNAMLGIAFLFLLHCVTIVAVLEIIWNADIINDNSIESIALPFMAISLGTNYFIFLYDGKYKLLADEFSQETAQVKKRKTFLIWIYVAASFGILAILGAWHW